MKNIADGVLFNGLIFLFSALLFAKNAAVEHWSIAAFGATFGILTVVFQLSYIKAMSLGNVSLTVMMVNLSMIIPIALWIAVYGEKLTPLRILGIILTVVAIVISIDRGQKSNHSKKVAFA